jgi:heme a synthase
LTVSAPETHSQTRPSTSVWLHRFTLLTAAATLGLIGVGGLVTSHGVGMAVPDWPNTYGYNMFFFPFSQWVGGIFYEHSHRLLASAVGLLTTILALWLHGTGARPLLRWGGLVLVLGSLILVGLSPRHGADAVVLGVTGLSALSASFVWPGSRPAAVWLRRLGWIAFLGVLLQGLLGGLRVVLFKDEIGIFHATLAQLFFVLMCLLAVVTSPRWEAAPRQPTAEPLPSPAAGAGWPRRGLSRVFFIAAGLVLAQLILGATMRHQHAGLAIPDFPLAYGKLWPATDSASVALYNQHRIEVLAANPITGMQIVLQMLHRLLALVILCAVAYSAWITRRQLGSRDPLARFSLVWLGLILIQALLGAATIWSNKAADIATLHVMVGALSLASGAILGILALRRTEPTADQEARVPVRTDPSALFRTRPSAVGGIK